jgi:hypothetical protein
MPWVEVEVGLEDFSVEDLLDELRARRSSLFFKVENLAEAVWYKRRMGQEYQDELDELLSEITGKIL